MKIITAIIILFGAGLVYSAITCRIDDEITTAIMLFFVTTGIFIILIGLWWGNIIDKITAKTEENLIEKQNNYGGNQTTKNLSRKIYSNV